MAIRRKRYLLKAALGVASVSVACGNATVGSVFVPQPDQSADASDYEPDGPLGLLAMDAGPDTSDASMSDVFVGKVTPDATKD